MYSPSTNDQRDSQASNPIIQSVSVSENFLCQSCRTEHVQVKLDDGGAIFWLCRSCASVSSREGIEEAVIQLRHRAQ